MDANPDNIRIVLTRPLYGGNVGAVCRAMANMGLRNLAIAAPNPLDTEEARMMACHAYDLFTARSEYPGLAEAVADCAMVVGTSARGGLYRSHAQPPRTLAPRIAAASAHSRVALVFGPEDDGLSNEDLALCTAILQIPTTPSHTSLNLAQAVLLCAYEVFLAVGDYAPPREKSPDAPSHLRERMFGLWRRTLFAIGFMKEDKADHMMLGLRRVLARGVRTEDDARIMMGIARQAEWSAGPPSGTKQEND
jgi:tRNA/rRNA methyltransferase